MEKFNNKVDEQNEDFISIHSEHYSEDKFWNKILKYAKQAGVKVAYLALLLFYTLQKPEVPKKAKAIIIGALGYFIFPLDLIPDLTPGIGFVDDLGALAGAIGLIAFHIDEDTKNKAKQKLHDWFGDFDQSEIENIV